MEKVSKKKIKEAVARSAARNDSRSDIEIALGRKMHEIGKAQAVFQMYQKRLQKLNDEANALDEELKKLDD